MTTEDKLKEISGLGERVRCHAAALVLAARGDSGHWGQDAPNQYDMLTQCAHDLAEAMKALPALQDIINEGIRNYKQLKEHESKQTY